MDAKEELTVELRRARGWILAVGIIMFVVDMAMVFAVYGDRLPSEWKTKLLVVDLAVLAFFIGMWALARRQPKVACTLALVGFWCLQITVAVWSGDPSSLVKSGLILKILFTMALVKGLRSASRAEVLRAELGTIFD